MGYRTYIGHMPKREYNKIKSMSEDQLVEFYNLEKGDEIDGPDYWYKGVYEYGKRLYEFGKYTDFNPPKNSLKPFFKNKELMKHYSEYDFYVVNPEFLAYIIESYKEKIKKYYADMISPFMDGYNYKADFLKNRKRGLDKNYDDVYTFDTSLITDDEQHSIWKVIDHVHSMSIEWNRLTPFDLNPETSEVVTSWKYEYAIFELVRIYKSFDWKRNVMIYYGY